MIGVPVRDYFVPFPLLPPVTGQPGFRGNSKKQEGNQHQTISQKKQPD
jgi:hypothetical protein